MPIKPESITKQQAEKFAELMDADFGRFLNDYQAIPVEKLANALIEAGIVSPPVWVVRDGPNGWLQTDEDNTSLYLSQTNTNILPQSYRYEHWKGQAE